jgi:hypothetical protein
LPILFTACIVVPLVLAAVSSLHQFTPDGTALEVEMRATGGTAAQLFWTSTWAFSEQDSAVVPLHQHPGQFERLRFPLPSRPLEFIRFDPLNGPGEVLIRRMSVIDRNGATVRTIDPILMMAMHQIDGILPAGDVVRVVTTKDANDPMLLLRSNWMTAVPRWYSLAFVTRWSFAWIATACLAVVMTGLLFVGRDLRRGPFTRRDALWLGALFLISLAARLALLDRYPMPVPFWDQWDGEAASLYLPYVNDGLTWHQMFTLHNEHRIFFTRVLGVALLGLNGQWDPQLQMFANSVLHSTTAVMFAAMIWMAAGRRWLPAITTTMALIVAPPFALENTLAGFQSQFYFLVLFSGFALWLMGTHRAGTAPWFFGWFCAFCAIFTVAGGILTVGAIGGLVLLKMLDQPREWRLALVNLAALASVAAVSYAALPPPLPYHEHLKAATWLAFKVSFARNLAFPWIASPRASVLLWVPLMLVAGLVLLRRLRSWRSERVDARSTPLEQLSLALGAWVAIQCAALAYSRGANGTTPASRYLDMLCLGFVANTMALMAIAAAVGVSSRRSSAVGATPRHWTIAGQVAIAAWLAIGAVGITDLSRTVIRKDGRDRWMWSQEYVRNVRHFVMSGDLASMAEKRGPQELPYFNSSMLGGWLLHPYIRHILPAVVRQPIALRARDDAQDIFVPTASPKDLIPVWDSYAAGRAKARGRFESEPTRCAEYGRVRFEVAGATRNAGMHLALKDTVTGRETVVRPPFGSGSGWTGVSVPCPPNAFTVVATDDSTTAWMAFRQPTEIGWLSAIAESTIQRWRVVAVGAALLLAVAIGASLRARPEMALQPARPLDGV